MTQIANDPANNNPVRFDGKLLVTQVDLSYEGIRNAYADKYASTFPTGPEHAQIAKERFEEFVKPGGRFSEVEWISDSYNEMFPGQPALGKTGSEIKIGEQAVKCEEWGKVINQEGAQIGAYLTVQMPSQATSSKIGAVLIRLDEPQAADMNTGITEKL